MIIKLQTQKEPFTENKKRMVGMVLIAIADASITVFLEKSITL